MSKEVGDSAFDKLISLIDKGPDGLCEALIKDLRAISAGRECSLSQTAAVLHQADKKDA